MSLLDPVEATVAPYLVWIKVGAAILAVIGLVGSGFYAGYRWESTAYLKLVASDATAQTAAVKAQADSDARQASVNVAAAVNEAKAQETIQTKYVTLTKEIPTYVTPVQDARTCATVGFLRVLRAAESGVSPGTLQLAPGQSDDDCSALELSAVAGAVEADFGIANQNAQQLSDLQQWVLDNHKAQAAP